VANEKIVLNIADLNRKKGVGKEIDLPGICAFILFLLLEKSP